MNHIFIDFNPPYIKKKGDQITLQKNPPNIYNASYRCWILSEEKFMEFMLKSCDKLCEFDSIDEESRGKIYFKGFLFRKKIKA